MHRSLENMKFLKNEKPTFPSFNVTNLIATASTSVSSQAPALV